MDSIKVKRGLSMNLPKNLPLGELAFCTDTQELWVGTGSNTPLKKVLNQDVLKDLTNKTTQIDSLIVNKRDKNVLLTKDDFDLSHNSRKIGLNNLQDEVIQAINGNAPVHSVIEDLSLTNEKYAPDSISEDKVAFIEKEATENLFDYTKVSSGYYSWDTGKFVQSSSYCHSILECEPGQVYRLTKPTSNCFVTFWTIDMQYISGLSGTNPRIVTPDGCKFVSFTHQNNDTLPSQMITLGEKEPSYFVPYRIPYLSENIPATKLRGSIVDPEHLTFLNETITYNIIDESQCKPGFYHYQTGIFTNTQAHWTSTHTPVKPNEKYTTTYDGYICYWTNDFVFITGVAGSGKKIQVPNNPEIAYATFTFSPTSKFFVYEGWDNKHYLPHKVYFVDSNKVTIDLSDNIYDRCISGANLQDNSVKSNNIVYNEIKRKHTNYYAKHNASVNLFNPNDYLSGYYYDANGKFIESQTYSMTEYIEVEENVHYECNFNTHVAFWAEDYTYIGGLVNGDSFTTPVGTKYITKPIDTRKNWNELFIVALDYIPHHSTIAPLKYVDNSLAITSDNLAFASNLITGEHLDFMELEPDPTGNLIVKENLIFGYFHSQTGSYERTTSYFCSNLVEIKPNTTYWANYSGHKCFWDSNKQYISGSLGSNSFTTPSNASYVSVTYNKEQTNPILVEGSSSPTLHNLRYQLNEEMVEVRANNYFIYERTENLYDPETFTLGYNHWETGKFHQNTTYGQTDFIKVNPNEKYKVIKTKGFVTFWDSNKEFVSGLSNGKNTFTIPENVAYFRAVILAEHKDTDMVVEHTITPLDYIPYTRLALSKDVFVHGTTEGYVSRISDKKWAVLGDSITTTHYGGSPYWKHIVQRTGITVYNHGISGSRVAQVSGRTDEMCVRYVNIEEDADIITIFGGTNDYSSRVPIGDIDSTDITTFCGALNVLLSGLINKFPGKAIGYIIPMRRRGMTNASNKAIFETYVNAVKMVCEKYSIPYLDLYNQGGLNPDIAIVNEQFFHNQDGLHPNNNGHERLSYRIESFIESL